MTDIAAELRLAGLDVIEGRHRRGRTVDVTGIAVRQTSTPKDAGAAPDVDLVRSHSGTVYVERSGRVWLLALGPLGSATEATVWQAVAKSGKPTDAQADATDAVCAVLSAVYALDTTDTPQVDASAAQVDAEGEPESA